MMAVISRVFASFECPSHVDDSSSCHVVSYCPVGASVCWLSTVNGAGCVKVPAIIESTLLSPIISHPILSNL